MRHAFRKLAPLPRNTGSSCPLRQVESTAAGLELHMASKTSCAGLQALAAESPLQRVLQAPASCIEIFEGGVTQQARIHD